MPVQAPDPDPLDGTLVSSVVDVVDHLARYPEGFSGRLVDLAREVCPTAPGTARAALQQLRRDGLVSIDTIGLDAVELTEAGWAEARSGSES